MFKPEQISELQDGFDEVQAKADEITEMLLCWDYKTAEGREYGIHGLARRMFNIAWCIQRVYELLPPQLDVIPDHASRKDAEVFIQAAVFGVYGALENLAFVWAFERAVPDKNGKPLSHMKIGFNSKRKEFWSSLPVELQEYFGCEMNVKWRSNLESFRHSLGHRIPLYIPPYLVKLPDYENLEKSKNDALGKLNMEAHGRLQAEQTKLRTFKPMIAHSLNDGTPPIIFHAQLLADFNTVEEACRNVFEKLTD
jgi:hypothetical protein